MNLTQIIDSIDDRIDSLEYLERTGDSDILDHYELARLIVERRVAGAMENLARIQRIAL